MGMLLEEGILGGISSGASVSVALAVAAEPSMAGKLVVAMVCDSGERYVTTPRLEGPDPELALLGTRLGRAWPP